jgi:hypothetical protein
METLQGPPRTSILDDFCFFMETVSASQFNLEGPAIVSLLIQKIIIGHYLKVLDFIRATNYHRQWHMTRQVRLDNFKAVEREWSDCQHLEKQISDYHSDMEIALILFGIPLTMPDNSRQCEWSDTTSDFQLIYLRLKEQHNKAKELNYSMTTLASIAGNRQASIEQQQSIREAKRARALTFVGLVFIPLAYTTSLLAMSEQFLPGARYFWVYFSISIPLVLVVLLSYFIMDLGYNDEAKWSVDHFLVSVRAVWKRWTGKRWIGKSHLEYEESSTVNLEKQASFD